MNLVLKHGIFLVVTIIIIVATLFIPSAPVENKDSLSHVSFGYPITFLSQDFTSELKNFLFFPNYYRLSFDFKAHPISSFSFWNFIADFLIIFGIIEVIVFILEKCKEFFVNRKIWPYSR